MYQALYRKWRPLTFDDVVGQEHITQTLKSQVRNDRLSHAYLFVGTRGTGKTTCAKILSRAVNCEHPVDGNPCNKCRSCTGILDGSVMDVVEMDAASNNGVDNVRALRDEAIFSPASVKKRVYIIDEVHMLSQSAFNALLKILEEPPEHLMFILATTELHKVPATILSRCQRYSFHRIEGGAVASRLMHIAAGEGLKLQPEAGRILARLSEGSMRDAVSLLDQCSGREEITAEDVLSAMGLAGTGRITELMDHVAARDASAALECFSRLWMDGKEPASLLDELASLYRDILVHKVAPEGGDELLTGGFDAALLDRMAGSASGAELLSALETIQSAQGAMRESLSPRVTAEMCLMELCMPELGGSLAALEKRVAKLERGISAAAAPESPVPPPQPVRRPSAPPRETAAAPEDRPPWEGRPEPAADSAAAPAPAETPAPAEPAPASETAAPAAETPQPGGTELWPKCLAALKEKLPLGTYNILCDPFHAEGAICGGELKIYVKNGFAMNMLKSPAVQDRLREAASAVGCSAVRLEEGAPPEPEAGSRTSRIDKLMQFGNVKFE